MTMTNLIKPFQRFFNAGDKGKLTNGQDYEILKDKSLTDPAVQRYPLRVKIWTTLINGSVTPDGYTVLDYDLEGNCLNMYSMIPPTYVRKNPIEAAAEMIGNQQLSAHTAAN